MKFGEYIFKFGICYRRLTDCKCDDVGRVLCRSGPDLSIIINCVSNIFENYNEYIGTFS